MPALFPPWSNTAIRLGVAALALGAIGLPTVLMVYMRTPFGTDAQYVVDQPVQFDHRHHVRDDGIDCRYCHHTAEVSSFAGVPSTALCMGCHSQVWNDSPLLVPVRASIFSGDPIMWSRVHQLPDFVYFNHAAHLDKGIGCEECHGRIDQMARVYQVKPLTMNWCLSCHRDPTPRVRPREEVTVMGWKPAGEPAAIHRAAAEEYGVSSLTSCTTCHR